MNDAGDVVDLPPEFLVALAAQAAIFEERIQDLEGELGTLQFRLKLHESAALHSSAAASTPTAQPPTASRAPSTASVASRGESNASLGIPARATRGSIFPGKVSRNPSTASVASPVLDDSLPASAMIIPSRRATSVVNLGWDGTVTEVVGRRKSVARPPSLVPKSPSHTSLAQSPSQAALGKSPSATELARPKSLVAKIDVDRASDSGDVPNVSPPRILPTLLMARRNVSFGPIAESASSDSNAVSDEEGDSISHPIADAALPAPKGAAKVRITTAAKGPFSAATVVPVDETDSATAPAEEAADETAADEDAIVAERVILDPPPLLTGLYQMLTASKINMLLILLPLAIISHFLSWSPDATFVLSLLAILPLAGLLGESTEEIALYTSGMNTIALGGISFFLWTINHPAFRTHVFIECFAIFSRQFFVWMLLSFSFRVGPFLTPPQMQPAACSTRPLATRSK